MDFERFKNVAFATIANKVNGSVTPVPSLETYLDSEWKWTTNHTFFETMLGFLVLSIDDKENIDGLGMAKLAELLVMYEIKAGGPYKHADGTVDIATNLVIHNLFTILGAPLLNVKEYIDRCVKENNLASTWASPTELDLLVNLSKINDARLTSRVLSPVAQTIKKELLQLPTPFYNESQSIWQAVNNVDVRGEITLLAKHFGESLLEPPGHSAATYKRLGVANFYTWMAYSIYDNFIDDEAKISSLPIANICQRKALYYYKKEADKNTLIFVDKIFNDIDEANFWELTHCRFKVNNNKHITLTTLPKYGRRTVLYKRSYAHVLGPLLITRQLACTNAQKNIIKRALQHYLVARQLNDDLHDWVADLKKGHISFVVAYLLKRIFTKPGTYEISQLINILQNYFWEHGIVEVTSIAELHCQKSRNLLTDTQLFLPNNTFLDITLGPIELALQKSVVSLTNQKQFLAGYENNIIT